MSKIDTQGMGAPMSPEDYAKWKAAGGKQPEHKPAIIKPRRLFTSQYVKEMKILINEVLDEREGNFHYTSYFDTEQFKHTVGEEEPEYTSHYKPAYYQ